MRPRILLVDDYPEGRFIVTKSLLRPLPDAIVIECVDSEAAVAEARDPRTSLAIVHRALDVDGLPLVELVRAANPLLPILYLSSADRDRHALQAGATKFLHYDKWLLVGSVVADLLLPQRKGEAELESDVSKKSRD